MLPDDGVTMHFNWDISLGTVIGVLSLGLGLWRAHVANIKRFSALEADVEIIKEWFRSWMSCQWSPRQGD